MKPFTFHFLVPLPTCRPGSGKATCICHLSLNWRCNDSTVTGRRRTGRGRIISQIATAHGTYLQGILDLPEISLTYQPGKVPIMVLLPDPRGAGHVGFFNSSLCVCLSVCLCVSVGASGAFIVFYYTAFEDWGSTESTKGTESTESTKSTEGTESTESTESTENAEGTESTESTEKTESTESSFGIAGAAHST